jgi:hypothetical protein
MFNPKYSANIHREATRYLGGSGNGEDLVLVMKAKRLRKS